MTVLHLPQSRPLEQAHGSGDPNATWRRRMGVAFLALSGAGLVGYGVALPWLSTYAGLVSQRGWGTRNGTILLAGSVAVAVVAVAHLLRPAAILRWMLAAGGFALAGFAGYLLVQLYAVFEGIDQMAFATKGPGLYVAVAGAAVVFSTVFVPATFEPTRRSREDIRRPVTADVAGADFHGTHLGGTSFRALFEPVRTTWRYPAAALAIAAGMAHVPVTPAHLQEAPYIGVLFILLTVACVLLATALLISDVPLVWLSLGGVCLLAVIGYAVSRTIGLPMMADDIGNWGEPLGIVSIATETLVVMLAAVTLRQRRRPVHSTGA
ncbi:MAG: hypothetical protein ACRDPG_12145 [Nocardioidaceae bacterium]